MTSTEDEIRQSCELVELPSSPWGGGPYSGFWRSLSAVLQVTVAWGDPSRPSFTIEDDPMFVRRVTCSIISSERFDDPADGAFRVDMTGTGWLGDGRIGCDNGNYCRYVGRQILQSETGRSSSGRWASYASAPAPSTSEVCGSCDQGGVLGAEDYTGCWTSKAILHDGVRRCRAGSGRW